MYTDTYVYRSDRGPNLGSIRFSPAWSIYTCIPAPHSGMLPDMGTIVVREYTPSSMKFAFTMAVITALPARLTCLYIVYITLNTL